MGRWQGKTRLQLGFYLQGNREPLKVLRREVMGYKLCIEEMSWMQGGGRFAGAWLEGERPVGRLRHQGVPQMQRLDMGP